MILSTLYKKDTKGKIRQWSIEVDGGQHRVITGLKDGKLVYSGWTQCEVKNEGKANATTVEDQAEKEAKALIKKQLERGYAESADDVDEAAVFKPMLAKDYNDYAEKLEYPLYSQPKLDGIRCIINKDGMWTRNNKPITACPHIFKAFEKVFKKNPDYIFDGELYNHALKENFNKICSLVKRPKASDEELAESKAVIQYWCYDIVTDDDFATRHDLLSKVLPDNESIIQVTTDEAATKDELDVLYGSYADVGYEGQMVRQNEPYQNKRTEYLLKRKEWKDGEWLIDEVFEGTGNRSGTAGYVTLLNLDGTPLLNDDGKQAKSNIKGDHEFLKDLLKRKDELHGVAVTIKYFNLTPGGVPRFPYVIAIRDYE